MQSSRMIFEFLIVNQPAQTQNICSDEKDSFQEKTLPVFIKTLADDTGLDPNYVNFLFDTNHPDFVKITYLSPYIKNHKNNTFPGISLRDALATTYQEQMNLVTTYPYVEAGYLSIEQAKNLLEDDRMRLLAAGSDEVVKSSFNAYQQYKINKNANETLQNAKNESMDSEQVNQNTRSFGC